MLYGKSVGINQRPQRQREQGNTPINEGISHFIDDMGRLSVLEFEYALDNGELCTRRVETREGRPVIDYEPGTNEV